MKIEFLTPALTGKDAVFVPASGRTKRQINAQLIDNDIVQNAKFSYCLLSQIEGVSLKENMVYISANVEESIVIGIKVTAKDAVNIFQIEIIKDNQYCDTDSPPISKKGWKLFFHDEFENDVLDYSKWSPYYLRGWTCDSDAKADCYIENNQCILAINQGRRPWCKQDGEHRVSSIQTFERTHLHRFGTVENAQNIQDFEGFATKYGYFELRARFPDTRDGSHFAWWMIGVQDDQNITAEVNNETYPTGKYSNQTAEFDIIEQVLAEREEDQTLSPKIWRPVIHPNGSADIEYLWVEPTTIERSCSAEFHVYGFEWDEEGTKFYLDGKLVQQTERSPNYRMMTLISLYGGSPDGSCGLGTDRGIYPKEAIIDYFRVYKKRELPKPSTVVIKSFERISFLRIPRNGTKTYDLKAKVYSQFHKQMNHKVTWELSENIQGNRKLPFLQQRKMGVILDPVEGKITLKESAIEDTDIYLTARYSKTTFAVKHIKLSGKQSQPQEIYFRKIPQRVKRDKQYNIRGFIVDQYGEKLKGDLKYDLWEDITMRKKMACPEVKLSKEGLLIIGKKANNEQVLVIGALASIGGRVISGYTVCKICS